MDRFVFLFCFATGALMHGFIDEKKISNFLVKLDGIFFLLLYKNDPFNRHHQQIEFHLQVIFDQDMSFYATFALICSIKVNKSLNRKKFSCFFFTFMFFALTNFNSRCSMSNANTNVFICVSFSI